MFLYVSSSISWSQYVDLLRYHLFPNIRVPQVLLHLPHIPLSKFLLRIFRANARRDNHVLSSRPVDRRRNALLVRQLQGINNPQHLRSVPSRRRRVRHSEADLLFRVNDKDRANGECNAAFLSQAIEVVLRDHVVEKGDVAVCVGDDGELNGGVGSLVDVFDPFVVG